MKAEVILDEQGEILTAVFHSASNDRGDNLVMQFGDTEEHRRSGRWLEVELDVDIPLDEQPGDELFTQLKARVDEYHRRTK